MALSIIRFQNISIIIFSIMVLNLGACSKKEQNDNQINIGTTTLIKSKIFDQEREIMIHLPVGYNEVEDNFPVWVMTDGQVHFNDASTMSDFLQRAQLSPGLIIVGLDRVNRRKNYTPPSVSDSANTGIGGADKFLKYIQHDVLPFVEANYRTSQYRILTGWSYGGLFAFFTMINQPELFDAYIALSPSFNWDEKRQVSKVIDFLGNNNNHIRSPIFMTVANEGGSLLEGVEEIADYLTVNTIEGLRWDFKHYPEESHYSGTFRGLFDGLELVFRPLIDLQSASNITALIQDGGIGTLDEQFDNLSNLYGKKITISENLLNVVGYRFLGENKPDLAILTFAVNVEKYPESPNTYDSLGDGYLAADRHQEAVSSFEKAVTKAREIEDPNLPAYESNFERAKKLLEEQSEI